MSASAGAAVAERPAPAPVADPVAAAGDTRSPSVTDARWRPAWDGVRDITPMVIGVVPFALAVGAAVGASSLHTGEGLVSGPAILAGAAQLTVVEMLDSGAAPLVIVLSALMINARILLYSASLAPWFAAEPLRRRLLLAAPVIDQLHFTCVPRFERGDLDRRGRRVYYAAAAAFLVSAWVVAQASAIVVGARVPEAVRLEVAAPLALVGLLAKAAVDLRSVVAAAVAAAVTVFGVALPFRSAVLVAAVAGIAAGVVVDARRSARFAADAGSIDPVTVPSAVADDAPPASTAGVDR